MQMSPWLLHTHYRVQMDPTDLLKGRLVLAVGTPSRPTVISWTFLGQYLGLISEKDEYASKLSPLLIVVAPAADSRRLSTKIWTFT